MRQAGLIWGWSAAGLLGVAAVADLAGAAQGAVDNAHRLSWAGLEAPEVGRALAGEWEGQVQVRSAKGELSMAPASMSARLNADKLAVEVFYEGFAFGKPIEGAMVFRFAEEHTAANIRDEAISLRATCEPFDEAAPDARSYRLGCESGSLGEFRVVFTRIDGRAWSIAYESREGGGEWSDMLTLQMDRLASGQRSAAADGFSHSALLAELRSDSVTASVDDEH